jgi:hypothetical protein
MMHNGHRFDALIFAALDVATDAQADAIAREFPALWAEWAPSPAVEVHPAWCDLLSEHQAPWDCLPAHDPHDEDGREKAREWADRARAQGGLGGERMTRGTRFSDAGPGRRLAEQMTGCAPACRFPFGSHTWDCRPETAP